jgi:hypothetical protein
MSNSQLPPYPRVPHPSGQARIGLDGKQLYLGKHHSPESLARYDELHDDWLRCKTLNRSTLTIDERAIGFLEYAIAYYVKEGVKHFAGFISGHVNRFRAAG